MHEETGQRVGPNYLDLGAGQGVWVFDRVQSAGGIIGLIAGALLVAQLDPTLGLMRLLPLVVVPTVAIALCGRVYGIRAFRLCWYAARYAWRRVRPEHAAAVAGATTPAPATYHRMSVRDGKTEWMEWLPSQEEDRDAARVL